MKKLLTYVLWNSTRYTKQPCQRYWMNIPYLLIANSCLFPDFHTRYYIHRNSTGHPFFVFLKKVSEKFEKVDLRILDIPYKGTQLTVQRLQPLWEDDVSYLFCRDIDYAVSAVERRCMDYFMEQNKCFIHSMRTRNSHSLMPLYAGLCGFDVKRISKSLRRFASTFDDYIKFGYDNVLLYPSGKWECDQYLLRDFFCHPKLSELSILDCPFQTAPLRTTIRNGCPRWNVYNPVLVRQEEYKNRKLIFCDPTLLHLINQLAGTPTPWNTFKPFVGRGWTCSSVDLRRLILLANNEMSGIIEKIFMDNFGKVHYKIDASGIRRDEQV